MTNSKELVAVYTLKQNHNICSVLHGMFGDPIDSYWNGSHTWFSEPEELNNIRLEWRLHPVSEFQMPDACRPEELFELILEEKVDPSHYVEGLEIFPVDDNNVPIENFNKYLSELLFKEPDKIGYVDHDEIGNIYEHSNGEVSIVKLLCEQLGK